MTPLRWGVGLTFGDGKRLGLNGGTLSEFLSEGQMGMKVPLYWPSCSRPRHSIPGRRIRQGWDFHNEHQH